jgi:hypothetical protein
MSALEAANIRSAPLIIVRNPLEVALSLRARDGFTIEKSMLIWLRHYIDAEYETRHLPRNIVAYEGLLEDWRLLVVQSAGRLGIAWPRSPAEAGGEIRAFLSHDLHHHRASRLELDGAKDVPLWVKSAYEALIRLCDEPKSGHAKRELDKIRQAFADGCGLFGTVAFAERTLARDREREAVVAIARAAGADALGLELAKERAAREDLGRDVARLTARHAELADVNAAAEATIARANAEIDQIKGELREASEAADEFERRADAADHQIADLLNVVAELEDREARRKRHSPAPPTMPMR